VAKLVLARPEVRTEPFYALVAVVTAAPAAMRGAKKDERLAGLDVCIQGFRLLAEHRGSPAARRVSRFFSLAHEGPVVPDPDPEVYEKLLELDLAAFDVGRTPDSGQGCVMLPRFPEDQWNSLPEEQRRKWIRMASRELELVPVRGLADNQGAQADATSEQLARNASELNAQQMKGALQPYQINDAQRTLRQCLLDRSTRNE
jgi:hypothetical protein